ncbi:Nn.00g089290.m01.CDS01 [Neocucurbitaria sp. VM-36]
MEAQTTLNRYFQTAIADPVRKVSFPEPRVYRSTTAPSTPAPATGTIKVIVGSYPQSQRTWILPRALLARHSAFFANHIQDPIAKEPVELQGIEPSDFQNFVDYMHSSIYSLNQQVTGYRAIRANTSACMLGIQLGAKAYHDAALRQLYMIFEPLARLRTSNARKSLIRASDVDFICINTAPSLGESTIINTIGEEGDNKNRIDSGIRQLFFDAVASHWTQTNVLNIGDTRMDTHGDTATWIDVYNTYTDFRITVANSLMIPNAMRAALLRPVDEYLDPKLKEVEISKEASGQEIGGPLSDITRDLDEWGGRIVQPRLRIPAIRRSSSDRRRMERVTDVERGFLHRLNQGEFQNEGGRITEGSREEQQEEDGDGGRNGC